MKEYEISNNNKVLGKVNIYNDNINKDLINSLIETNSGLNYETISIDNMQTYEIEYIVNDIDELFDIISKYIFDNDKVFEEIEKIKEYNDIKTIKKETKIKLVVPELYLNKLNKSKEDVDTNSILISKVHFIKNVLNNINNNDITLKLNNIINEYNGFIHSNEYEFLEMEEKENNINKYIKTLNELINQIETETQYRYTKDFILPIKLNN